MNKTSKKTAFGITTAAAATALVAGFAAPAMASTAHSGDNSHGSQWSSSNSSSSNRTMTTTDWQKYDLLRNANVADGQLTNWSPITVSPEIGIGDVASNDAIGSGNDVPLLSGNTVSGNTTSVPVVSGNDTAVGNNDGGNSIGTDVQNLVHNLLNGNSASSWTKSTTTTVTPDNGSNSDGLLGGLLG